MERRSVSVLAYIVALVIFLVTALGGPLWGASQADLIAYGLAAFALAHVLP